MKRYVKWFHVATQFSHKSFKQTLKFYGAKAFENTYNTHQHLAGLNSYRFLNVMSEERDGNKSRTRNRKRKVCFNAK